MRIIKTRQHFDVLNRVGTFPVALLENVEGYFTQLMVELEDETEGEFCLGKNGYIVILESGDNVRNLGNVGLNRESGGLLGSCLGFRSFFHSPFDHRGQLARRVVEDEGHSIR